MFTRLRSCAPRFLRSSAMTRGPPKCQVPTSNGRWGLHTAGKARRNAPAAFSPILVALVAFMTTLAASSSGAFGVVGEVVGIVFLAAADLLLRHSLLAGRVFLRLGFVGMLILCRHSLVSCSPVADASPAYSRRQSA